MHPAVRVFANNQPRRRDALCFPALRELHVPIYDVCSTKEVMEYRYLTNSIGGFIQQLAVCYIQRGYWFYVVGSIPAGKDPEQIDRKLLDQYGISLSKYLLAGCYPRGASLFY